MSCKDILECIFDLNQHDIAVFNTLREKGELRVQTLAHHLNKDRSTVYRSLQKLTNCGICKKKTHHLTKGGHYHTYSCTELEYMRKQMKTCINQWYENMQETLTHLEAELH
jgi:CRISPR locus-related DNA-binding protein